jgi:hypothetical protein
MVQQRAGDETAACVVEHPGDQDGQRQGPSSALTGLKPGGNRSSKNPGVWNAHQTAQHQARGQRAPAAEQSGSLGTRGVLHGVLLFGGATA